MSTATQLDPRTDADRRAAVREAIAHRDARTAQGRQVLEEASAALEADRLERQQRARKGSVTFRSVEAALRYYFTKRRLLQGATAMAARTETHPDTGEQVRVSVDGGRGGDLDEVLATVHTIGKALAHLHRNLTIDPNRPGRPSAIGAAQYAWMLTALYGGVDGMTPPGGRPGQLWTQSQVASRLKVSQQTVSDHVQRAERMLAGVLREGGVVV